MKKYNRRIRVSCMFLLIFLLLSSITALAAEEYVYETPVEKYLWEDPGYDENYAYSIAFVGDTQFLTKGDQYTGTRKLKQVYKYIADTAEERKLVHVFGLGDITHGGYWNDANLASKHVTPADKGEWELAKEAISQLDGVVSYSLNRGNHDDYMIDDYFNVPEYTDQFKENGGFFSDSDAKHPVEKSREELNPEGYIYWTETSGHYENSIVNSWKAVNVCGTDYLFITVDYNPTEAVCNWLDGLLAEYPNHRAIITMHSYLNLNGYPIMSEEGDTMYPTGYQGAYLWNNVISKHENVLMIVSGHVGVMNTLQNWGYAANGKQVLQVLVDPQEYDTYEDENGNIIDGKQDTGLVLYMNFSEDGNKITFDYYSTLLNKNLVMNRQVIDLTNYTIETPKIERKKKETPVKEETVKEEIAEEVVEEEPVVPETEEVSAEVTENTENPSVEGGIRVGTAVVIAIGAVILICIGVILYKKKK